MSDQTANGTSVFYLPEGSEFSIYYGDKYLYMTPDIFTGLMTGLFMFFIMLTGFRCLGDIGNSSAFVTKMPALGKEA